MPNTRPGSGGTAGVAALVAILAIHILLCFAARPGFLASDDLYYATYANDLANGSFSLAHNHFGNRLGLIAPTAASYLLFGVSEVSSVLWPLLCSLVSIALVFFVARGLAGKTAGWIAAALVGLNPAQVSSSLLLLPDGPTGTLLLGAAAALLAARRTFGGGRRFAMAALSACLVAAAFLTKMTTVWIVPFLAVLGIRDVRRARHRDLWAAMFSLLMLLGVGYLLAYRAWSGDALFRLHIVEAGHNRSDWSYVGLGGAALLARLVHEPAVMLLGRPELAIPLLLALPAAIVGLRRGAGDHGRWSIYLLSILGSWWLLPTSLHAWNPLPLLPRMLVPVLPAAAILAATALAELRYSAGLAMGTAAVLLVAAAAALPLAGAPQAGMFAATAVLVAGSRAAWVRGLRPGDAAAFAVVVPLALMTIYSVHRGGIGETPAQAAERVIVRDHLRADREAVVFAEPRSASAILFRLGFPEDCRVEFTSRFAGSRADFLYVNDDHDRLRAQRGESGLGIRRLAEHRKLRVIASQDGVTLYRPD